MAKSSTDYNKPAKTTRQAMNVEGEVGGLIGRAVLVLKNEPNTTVVEGVGITRALLTADRLLVSMHDPVEGKPLGMGIMALGQIAQPGSGDPEPGSWLMFDDEATMDAWLESHPNVLVPQPTPPPPAT